MRAAFLDGFLEGLEAQFRAQVGADPTLALLLVIHPAVRDHMAEIIPPGRPPLEEDPDRDYPTDEEALRAGHEAGRTFRAERTPRLGEGTRQLPC
jgi:hypothetical protein